MLAKFELIFVPEETVPHLLFTCSFATGIWNKCYVWWGIHNVIHMDPKMHLLQHNCDWLGKEANERWRVVWFAIVWSLWLHRNEIVFNKGSVNGGNLLELIKFKSWLLMTCKIKNFKYYFYEWSIPQYTV